MNRIFTAQRSLSVTRCRTLTRKDPLHTEPLVSPVRIETRGRVMVIMLNNPKRRNAVNRFMAQDLYSAIKGFEKIDKGVVSCAVLASTSNDFCSGYDLHDVASQGIDDALELLNRLKTDQSPMGPCKFHWKKPVIAAIEGACVAGGLELALCADLRVGSKESYYGIYNRRFGIPLIDGGTARLPLVVGHGRALDMILTGRRVEAEEAHSMGLINRLVEPGDTISEAVKLANEIIQNPLIPMLSDRDAVYKNISVAGISEQIDNEIENGKNALKSAFKSKAALRFASGQGRSGKKKN